MTIRYDNTLCQRRSRHWSIVRSIDHCRLCGQVGAARVAGDRAALHRGDGEDVQSTLIVIQHRQGGGLGAGGGGGRVAGAMLGRLGGAVFPIRV